MSKIKEAKIAFTGEARLGSRLSLEHIHTILTALNAIERMQGVDLEKLEKMIKFYTLPRPPSYNVFDYVEAEKEILNAAQTLADIKKEVE